MSPKPNAPPSPSPPTTSTSTSLPPPPASPPAPPSPSATTPPRRSPASSSSSPPPSTGTPSPSAQVQTPTLRPPPPAFTSRLVDTDADHTGSISEAVTTLPAPLAPGASLSLIALYSGAIPPSAERLTRIGAPGPQAAAQDWDSIAPTDPAADSQTGTALRGFGNVLWYPVSAPPVFLGDGARLFSLVGRTKLRQSTATLRLRLAVDYTGEPPDAAYLCGRRAQLTAISDNADAPAADAPGIATTAFDAAPIGFRQLPRASSSLPSRPGTSSRPATSPPSPAATWSCPPTPMPPPRSNPSSPRGSAPTPPNTPLTILDHPGDPFEDDALLVQSSLSSSASLPPTPISSTRNRQLSTYARPSPSTHAWIHSSHRTSAWIDEGLPEFMSLLWTERTQGRAAALAQLQELTQPLALAEPDPTSTSNSSAPGHAPGPAGASLADSSDEIFYRNKAAAVWWMLRSIAGDDALKQALQTYRRLSEKDSRPDQNSTLQPDAFEKTLESATHMDLAWFFRDWVYNDRGLPDLQIANVTPSQLEPNGAAAAGFLVGIEVRNDGFAEAQVPVIVRSAGATETRQLRIPGRASASVRIVFAGRPNQVQVNDGSVPETQSTTHTRELTLPTK